MVARVATTDTSNPASSQFIILRITVCSDSFSVVLVKSPFKVGRIKRIAATAVKESWKEAVKSCSGENVRMRKAAKKRRSLADFFLSIQSPAMTTVLIIRERTTGGLNPAMIE